MSERVWYLFGVVAGVFAERLAQRYGKLRYEVEPMGLEIFGLPGPDTESRIHSLPLDITRLTGDKHVEPLEGPPWVGHSVVAELFNEKELRTGLRGVAIVFRGRSGTQVETTPDMRGAVVEMLNLPFREWIRLDLHGEVGAVRTRELANCETVVFRGRFPNRRVFVKPIPIARDPEPEGSTGWGNPP